jgi:purine nucleoside permease
MTDSGASNMPAEVARIAQCGYAIWAKDDVDANLRARFDAERIPVAGVRHVRIWGLQVDDERELPGLERTQIPDEEVWEVNLEALDGSKFEVDSRLLKPAG